MYLYGWFCSGESVGVALGGVGVTERTQRACGGKRRSQG